MKQPDRFDRLAEKECRSWPMFQFIRLEPLIAKLLRRQHRAIVRLVKRTTNGGVDENMKANILAALARYRRGTP